MLAVALIVGIGAAAVVSMWTAVLVAKMKIAPFIASLSTMTIARGIALVLADGIPHTIKNAEYSQIGNGYLWDASLTGGVGFPILVLILIVIAVITTIILYNTKFGRYIYAVGGNEHAAEASGVNVVKIKFWTYVLNGVLCGVAGMMLAARITSGQPNAGDGYELDAIAASVVGGASLSGGEMKRIEIASVLARGAKLSIFDEPEAGIDLWSFSRLVETFQDLRSSGKGGLMIISHQERILSIADEIIVIANGRVRAHGPKDEILPGLLTDERSARCPLGKEDARV